jgi:uncharacterized protein YycO
MRVDGVGTGGIFIKRKVLERIKTPFSYEFDKDGVIKSSDDIAFCHRCNLAGFEIWVDWSCLADHYKTVGLLKVAEFIIKAAESGIPKISE